MNNNFAHNTLKQLIIWIIFILFSISSFAADPSLLYSDSTIKKFMESYIYELRMTKGTIEKKTRTVKVIKREDDVSNFELIDYEYETYELKGHFSVNKKLGKFVDNHPNYREEIVKILIQNLSNLEPSNVDYHGNKAPMGILFYNSLSGIVYHEHFDQNDVPIPWEGHIELNATPEQLNAAKKAWEKVFKQKHYSFL